MGLWQHLSRWRWWQSHHTASDVKPTFGFVNTPHAAFFLSAHTWDVVFSPDRGNNAMIAVLVCVEHQQKTYSPRGKTSRPFPLFLRCSAVECCSLGLCGQQCNGMRTLPVALVFLCVWTLANVWAISCHRLRTVRPTGGAVRRNVCARALISPLEEAESDCCWTALRDKKPESSLTIVIVVEKKANKWPVMYKSGLNTKYTCAYVVCAHVSPALVIIMVNLCSIHTNCFRFWLRRINVYEYKWISTDNNELRRITCVRLLMLSQFLRLFRHAH